MRTVAFEATPSSGSQGAGSGRQAPADGPLAAEDSPARPESGWPGGALSRRLEGRHRAGHIPAPFD